MKKQNLFNPTPLPLIIIAIGVIYAASLLPIKAHASSNIKLRPPFEGTYRVTSYFDHDAPNYSDNDYIWIYNGERRPSNSQSDTPSHTGRPYPYDGHDGWDWSMTEGQDILAAAAGRIVVAEWGNWGGGYGRTIVISHNDEYYTIYSHLDQLWVDLGDIVTVGQHIADSGATPPGMAAHLHFGVRHNGYVNTTYAVDPFGWRGHGSDPLINFNGETSTCLWRSLDEDPISCADTIVEDAAGGSVAYPAENWQTSNRGNGYHTFYHSNTTEQYDYHTWSTSAISNTLSHGPCKIYAFIPGDPDGNNEGLAFSEEVSYVIWTVEGWETLHVSQDGHDIEWLSLGTFLIPGQTEAGLWAQTSEPADTRWVIADELKFRQYHNYLPLITDNRSLLEYSQQLKQSGELIVNGDFVLGDDLGWLQANEPIVHQPPSTLISRHGATSYNP